jgi:hypothetical protein
MHELAHALGFASVHWPYFRNSLGGSTVERDRDRIPLKTDNYDCPLLQNSHELRSVAVPSSDVVRIFHERGGRVAKVVTPTVLKEGSVGNQ